MGKVYAHDQSIHQHIIREAWKLLVYSYPGLNNSEMANYIGTNETNDYSIAKSWGNGTIAAGTWIEDEYDIVYHYGIGEKPTFNQTLTPEFYEFFAETPEDERAAYTSITHFWNADGGIDQRSLIEDQVDFLGGSTYWSFWCENAMQKMYRYLYGNFNNRCIYKNPPQPYESCFQMHLETDFSMPDLFTLYNRNYLQAERYISYADPGNWIENSCAYLQINRKIVYNIIGRMCHLLGDMSVPAHVHTNSHACTNGMYCDYYESIVNTSLHHYNAEEIWDNGGRFINPYVSYGHPLYYLMYYINQLTDHFADGQNQGDDNYDLNCPGLYNIVQSSNWQNMRYPSQVNYQNCSNMHTILFPEVIKATAGLLYWFAVETNQLPDPNSINTTDNFLALLSSQSQKKFIRDGYGYIWKVYEKSNLIYVEKSSDNGNSWIEQNYGRPISSLVSKNPVIENYREAANWIGIIFERKNGNNKEILLATTTDGLSFTCRVLDSDAGSWSTDAKPVLAWGAGAEMMAVWKETNLQYIHGYCYATDMQSFTFINGYLPNCSASSDYPTIGSADHYALNGKAVFHVAWQEGTSSVRYAQYQYNGSTITASNFSVVSVGSGFSYNQKPVISVRNIGNINYAGQPYISWLGSGTGTGQAVLKGHTSTAWSTVSVAAGSYVSSTNNNVCNSLSGTTAGSIMSWRQTYGTTNSYYIKVKDGMYQYSQTFSPSNNNGVAITEGNTFSEMKAFALNTSAPYTFQTSSTNFDLNNSNQGYFLLKTETEDWRHERAAVIVYDDIEFVYSFGSIELNGEDVKFKIIENPAELKNSEKLSKALVTEEFHLDENSVLLISNAFYAVNSTKIKDILNAEDRVEFVLQLRDSQNDKVITNIDPVIFNSNDSPEDKNNYEILTKGIVRGTYYLALDIKVKGNAKYFLSEIIYDQKSLPKKSYAELKITEKEFPDEFTLIQNYPNPFNPSTTINYNIPVNSKVLLKVFDILGREVTTLVDEIKSPGKYNVVFDGSTLASGVYLYSLRANEINIVKKMTLVK